MFRPTTSEPETGVGAIEPSGEIAGAAPGASGRVRHDEKITVYINSEELLALERVRLELRAHHGLAVDRGRIVRAAISDALADFAANGADSVLVRRLAEQ